jgi:hypothetical protein
MTKKQPFHSYLSVVNNLEQEFYEDFADNLRDISKEIENRLPTVNNEWLTKIMGEVIIRLCVNEICRWSCIYSDEGRTAMWKKINTDQKILTIKYFKQFCKYIKSHENRN